MSPHIWMPLYIADYLRDTAGLSAAEHGGYLLLLMAAWHQGGLLPIEDEKLRRIAQMDPKDWKRSRNTILGFFRRDPDGYRQKRLERELAHANQNMEAVKEQRRVAGQASAEARKRQRQGNGPLNEPLNEPSTGGARSVNGPANGSSTPSPVPPPTEVVSKKERESINPSTFDETRAREAGRAAEPPGETRPDRDAKTVGEIATNAVVSRVAKAHAMAIPFGEVRAKAEQITAMERQPEVVDTSGYRWAPAPPAMTPAEMLRAIGHPELIDRLPAEARP